MADMLWVLALAVVLLVVAVKVVRIKRVTIYEYQKGLKYSRGHSLLLWAQANIGSSRPFPP